MVRLMGRPQGVTNGTTRERVRELDDKGLSPVEIAKVLGVTRQAIYQHLARIEQNGSKR